MVLFKPPSLLCPICVLLVCLYSTFALAQKTVPSTSKPLQSEVRCGFEPALLKRTGLSHLELQVIKAATLEKSSLVSGTVVFADQSKLALKPWDTSYPAEDEAPVKDVCKEFSLLQAGPYAVLKQYVMTGNPFPVESLWFIHITHKQLVPSSNVIHQAEFIEQKGVDCLLNTAKGDANDPGMEDLWCATATSHTTGKLTQFSKIMSFTAKPGYIYFQCSRQKVGAHANVSNLKHVVDMGDYRDVTNPTSIALANKLCLAWSNELKLP